MRDAQEADIKRRNAGAPCLTIWKDGSFVHHGLRDAEIAEASEPDDVLITIRLDSLEPITFLPTQDRIKLYEKLLVKPRP